MGDPVREQILQATRGIRPEDFRFTVTVYEVPYDVYRIVCQGREGTLAFRITPAPEKKVIIAVFAAGTLTREDVQERIRHGLE